MKIDLRKEKRTPVKENKPAVQKQNSNQSAKQNSNQNTNQNAKQNTNQNANQKKAANPAVVLRKHTSNQPEKSHQRNDQRKSSGNGKDKLRLIPLGGLHEIGKNMTALEYKNEIIIIDCGIAFPEDDMFGIDVVIPDFDYVVKNSSKVKALILTHGHEDHIGGIPYLLQQISVPIYGTRLTLGLVQSKTQEHGLTPKLKRLDAGQKITIGPFQVESIRTTHSIADSVCYAIETDIGTIFHTGDFKVDYTPVDGEPINFQKLAEIGKKGVMLMLSDSTNALRKGYTESEHHLEKVLDNIFSDTENRIIIATFASNVHRIQTIINMAAAHKRKVAISGRSVQKVLEIAIELGYVKIPPHVFVDLNEIKNIPDKKLLIITTGSQGEPMSALSRMANGDHRAVQIRKGDRVILSSSPIPGNEKTVSKVVNKLLELEAQVIYSDIADIHVSGHACQEELKLMLTLIKPKYFLPVHGEYRHLHSHAHIARNLGIPANNVFVLGNGEILEMTSSKVSLSKETVEVNPVFVDGLGVGDISSIVLRDRRLLSESGLIIVVATLDQYGSIVSGPDIISRGFVYVKENEELIEEVRFAADEKLRNMIESGTKDWSTLKNAVRDELSRFIYKRTERKPVILTIFMEA